MRLRDRYVSRLHAKLKWDGSACIIQDLDSRQGTYINGQRIEGQSAFEVGDRLKIGSYELLYESLVAEPDQRVFSTQEENGRFVIRTQGDFSEHRYADIQ